MTIKIKDAILAQSAVYTHQYPEEQLREIVLLGRSNVGKSSLINSLIQRKNLARTSSQPGKTRLINFYRVQTSSELGEKAFYLVDLPGYGYAKAAQTEREKWLGMIDKFLMQNPENKFCWQIVDIRHAPSVQDLQMCRILKDAGYRHLIIATKADKISKSARAKNLLVIQKDLQVGPEDIFTFSSETKEGRDELLEIAKSFIWEVDA